MKYLQSISLATFLLVSTNVAFAKSGNVKGTILNQNGERLARVNVSIGKRSAITDARGRYLISRVSTGKRVIQANKSDFKTAKTRVNVRSAKTVQAPLIYISRKGASSPASVARPARSSPSTSYSSSTSSSTSSTSTTPSMGPIASPSIPNLALWESNMKTFGSRHCNELSGSNLSFDGKLASTYYDAQWVYYRIYKYTGDRKWFDCAQAAEAIYRDQYVVPSNGNVPGYWNFTKGLLEDYLQTGDSRSKDAVISISKNGAFGIDATPLSSTADSTMSREVAYNMLTYMNAEELGQPRRSRLGELKNQAIDHLKQWFVSKNAPYIRPFMVSLTAHALIEYNERIGDARILPLLKIAADSMWANLWMADKGSFKYTNVDTAQFSPSAFAYNTGGTEAAPDLNLLIAPLYAWLFHQTGEIKYRNQADAIFNGGVTQAYLVNGKQFNQSYRLSFDYIKWRSEAPLVAAH